MAYKTSALTIYSSGIKLSSPIEKDTDPLGTVNVL